MTDYSNEATGAAAGYADDALAYPQMPPHPPSGGDYGGERRRFAPDSPRPRQRRPPRGDSLWRRHRLFASLAILAAVVVVVAGVGLYYVNNQINPSGRRGPLVSVTVPVGASSSRIGTILAKAGVIHSGGLFPYYVKLSGSGSLLPGSYRLPRNETYGQAINALQQGPVLVTERLTIPEGFTLAQIADRVAALPHLHLSAAKFLAAASSGQVRSPYEPAGVNNLEGLVFPATYKVRQGQSEADVLTEMVGAFDQQATALGLPAAAAKLKMTPYQVVTVASIVERESKLAGDRGNVASVIYNRLAHGIKLGADSTQTYYLRLTAPNVQPTVAQLDTPSPYNTRTQAGLPPTPIANPGVPSLQAAIAPPATSYLYFVEVKPTGQLGFASTSAGFAQLQAQCRAANLC